MGLFKKQNAGFSAQIHSVTTKTWFFKEACYLSKNNYCELAHVNVAHICEKKYDFFPMYFVI